VGEETVPCQVELFQTELLLLAGCNWYGFGAIFFGCLSMLLHGTISYTRYKTIVRPHDREQMTFI
jgi:hypothetical protein